MGRIWQLLVLMRPTYRARRVPETTEEAFGANARSGMRACWLENKRRAEVRTWPSGLLAPS
jgi:hypothetical protein